MINYSELSNDEYEFITSCQKEAGMFIYRLKRRETTRGLIKQELENMKEDKREEVRRWLNIYMQM